MSKEVKEQVMEIEEVEEITEVEETVEAEEIKEEKVKWLDKPLKAKTPREALKNGAKTIGKGIAAGAAIAGAVVVGMFVQKSRDEADAWDDSDDYDSYEPDTDDYDIETDDE